MEEKKRCYWCNDKNPLYVKYHDEEWGILHLDDERYLFGMLVLEGFQAGLTWECILNKRKAFRDVFLDFDPEKVSRFDEQKVSELTKNKGIIRNRRKILSAIKNAAVFLVIQKEFGSFKNYLLSFSKGKTFREIGKTHNALSDRISLDLHKRGMRFVGPTIVYSYLQAIGIVKSHEKDCFLFSGD